MKLFQEALEELFPNWDDLERHREVVNFCRDLMNDPSALKNHIEENYQGRRMADNNENDEDGNSDTAVAKAEEIYKELIG